MNLPLHFRLQTACLLAAFLCQTLAPFAAAAPPPLPAQGVPQLMNYQGRVSVGGQNFDGTGYFKFSLVDGGTDQNRTATATCTVDGNGEVREFQVVDGGTGYVAPPSVNVTGTGSGLRADAVLDGDRVSAINVVQGGSGYSQVTPTTVTIAPPPANLVPVTFWSNDGSGMDGKEPQDYVQRSVTKGLYSVLLGEAGMFPLTPQVFSHPDVRLRVWFSAISPRAGGTFTLLTPDQRIAAVGYALMADDVKDGAITSAKLAANSVTLAQLSPELRETINGLQAWQATQLPVITSAAAAAAAVDNLFTYQITATGSPVSWNATGLPPGWSLNAANGVVFATPPNAGTFTFNVTATNNAGTSAPRTVSVTVAAPVFVDYATGSDGNAGTQAAPVKTVAQGIAIAEAAPVTPTVRVSGATQPLGIPLALKSGVNLRGGYDRAAGWTRTAPRTPLTYTPSATGHAAVTATSLFAPVLFDGFAVSCAANFAPGASSVGVRVHGSLGVITLSNNTITAGAGGDGSFGQAGANGVAGVTGFNAVDWRGPNYPAASVFSQGHPPAHYFGCGGTPVYGSLYGPQYASLTAYEGWPGSQYNGAGTGGAAGTVQTPPGNGAHGSPAGNGIPGGQGGAGSGPHLASDFAAGDGYSGTNGNNGAPGFPGGGGGGIASGNQALWGGGGGGGGTGGKGGAAGAGGKGAGGSFAVMVINAPVVITGCTLNTSIGGNGGPGGNGGHGSLGGNGGAGFSPPAVNGLKPGNGGWGSSGGNGGAGGGGAGGNGGPSIGIIATSAQNIAQSGNTFTLGNAGAGGLGGMHGLTALGRAASGTAGLRQNILTGVAP